MKKTNFNELLESGVHFGHLKKKWNPAMKPYVLMERNGIHIIDLHKTLSLLETAAAALKQIVVSGKTILFVATKKQAQSIVANYAKSVNMPYITERWPGGLLTNFSTIRKSIKKMDMIDKMESDGTLSTLSKRERLQISRTREKLEKNLGSISKMSRMPSAIFIVDINKESIAVSESRKLGILTFAMVDTNSNPDLVSYPIPSNDDSSKSIEKIMQVVIQAVKEGLDERSSLKATNQNKDKKSLSPNQDNELISKEEKTSDTEEEKVSDIEEDKKIVSENK